eukprot:TRINITY_DN7338_c2_g1_i1.p1 TRINITY_DN7338_c2_g1~~TRINITY_DN7338_c2_g1_i1.p1  ORF type:complete len:213 (+),score=39.47 TRINITY_DN7338_c2_g1_i1:66-704(+)
MTTSSHQKVVFVRHGERLDEANKRAWWTTCNDDNWHDPPVTERGKDQATEAGKIVRSYLETEGRLSHSLLYTSPSLRTVGTAARIGVEIEQKEFILTPGLYECSAAAKRDGLANLKMNLPDSEPFTSCSEHFPVSPTIHGSTSDTFISAVDSILDAVSTEAVPIVVTHREGIYDMMENCSVPIQRLPYCVCMEFLRHTETKEWSFGKIIHPN